MRKELFGYIGPAVIVKDDHRVDVKCRWTAYQEMVSAGRGEYLEGSKGWSGHFRAAPLELRDSGAAHIEMPDGSGGEILITHLEVTSGRGDFTGNRAPPDEPV